MTTQKQAGERALYAQGTKVICNGHEGAIVRHYDGDMYEIRLPGGVTCTDEFVVVSPKPTEKEIKTMTQTTDSEAGRIERAYVGIQKLRDAHYSLSQKGDNETDAHVHTLVAAAYDKALAELRVAFHLQPQPWEEYEAKAEEPATIHKQKGN